MELIGTPFSEKDIEEKAAPVWQQIVTDENGKRRFHGAFTGGFSAGYWNTVGSAEGIEIEMTLTTNAFRLESFQFCFISEESLKSGSTKS